MECFTPRPRQRGDLRLAAECLDGIVILPGDTVPYWKCIGSPTRRKGCREGMLLKNGAAVLYL